MDEVSLEQVNQFNLMKQHLAPDSLGAEVVQVVEDVAGLHATSVTTPYLSLYARIGGFSRDDLDQELYDRHTLGKIRCVRRTIYVHTTRMMPVAWGATAAKVLSLSRRFMEARGVAGEVYDELAQRIVDLLRGREMSTADIKASLDARADLSPVLYYMCDQGLLVRGRPIASWKDRRQGYALFREWFPDVELKAMTEEQAIAALVAKYLAAFGPVTEGDVVWWTGLGKRAVRRGLRALRRHWCELDVPGLPAGMICLRSDVARLRAVELADEPAVNLLPTLDGYVMGYKDRTRYLDPADAEHAFDRTGNATSMILVGGRTCGVWDFEEGDPPTVKLFPFRPLDPVVWERVRAAAQAVGRFMADQDVAVQGCDAMVPLTRRPAGHVMSPLKEC